MVERVNQGSTQPRRKEFVATAEKPFHFVDCGLDYVYLIGIRYFQDEDGGLVAEIPALKQLMQLIANDVVTSPVDLTGQELRFLRKRLGRKAAEFCKYLNIEPETLSRMENGKQPISAQVQKLARLSYCAFSQDQRLIECGQSILQSILEEISAGAKKKIVLEMGADQEWRERKAA
jgi:transcriptional regulator with XRE-family HTH domain